MKAAMTRAKLQALTQQP